MDDSSYTLGVLTDPRDWVYLIQAMDRIYRREQEIAFLGAGATPIILPACGTYGSYQYKECHIKTLGYPLPHITGGARMGPRGPETVVDNNGAVYDVPKLYVTGSPM